MTRRFALRWPTRIATQIALIATIAILVFHAVASVVFFVAAPPPPPGAIQHLAALARFVQILDATRPEDRQRLLDASNRLDREFSIALADAAFAVRPDPLGPPETGDLRALLGGGFTVTMLSGAFPEKGRRLGIMLTDGTPIIVTVMEDLGFGATQRVSWAILGSLGFLALNLVLLSIYASRALTAPLSQFARRAEEFSLDGSSEPLPEAGPDEVKVAARALNRLTQRIRAMVGDRTRMLAAIGHDLRTPITRMRLRTEFIADDAAREHFARDLDQMDAMVHGALAYLRDGRVTGTRTPVDLPSLLRTVCDQFDDMGKPVTLGATAPAVVTADADALMRAVTNLVENAVKYAGPTEVSLERMNGFVHIVVSDEGPGISAADRLALVEPFARGDEARGQDALSGVGGFGLGLSIARSIAEGHGGELRLEDNEPAGLRAIIALPSPKDR